MKKTVVLIVLDGWGIGPKNDANPIYRAQTPTINQFKKFYPSFALQSAGIAVGLPWGEPGNSEVGHMTMGTGQIIYQNFPRISLAIKNNSFQKNEVLNQAIDYANQNNSVLHLLGLISSGNVHSSYEHLQALLRLAAEKKAKNVYLHLFTDGRDSAPQSGKTLIAKLENDLQKIGIGKIASLSGRYYALDRTKNWQNTKKVYDLVVKGIGRNEADYNKIFDSHYSRGLSDSFIEPTLIGNPNNPESLHLIKNNDSIIFFDFREDCLRQIASPFALDNFSEFPIEKLENLKITTLTDYDSNLKTEIAFPADKIKDCLSSILSQNNLKQLKIAETEKYYHLTFFFNGLIEPAFPNEFRILIPSKETPRFDDTPEMRAPEITERVITALQENTYDFIAINFANPDTLAHTGNYEATKRGIEIVDQQLNQIYKVIQKTNATLLITSDHGNAECLYNSATGEKETCHNANPVPLYIIDENYKQITEKSEAEILKGEQETIGVLCDIAPTILELLGIKPPKTMTGQSLLKYII